MSGQMDDFGMAHAFAWARRQQMAPAPQPLSDRFPDADDDGGDFLAQLLADMDD